MSIVYEHMLTLREADHKNISALTLMSTDVDRIATCLVDIHETWARFVEVGIAIFLLARQIGWICVKPVVIVACKYIRHKAASKFSLIAMKCPSSEAVK